MPPYSLCDTCCRPRGGHNSRTNSKTGNFAQRGPDEAAERPPKGVGGLILIWDCIGSLFSNRSAISRSKSRSRSRSKTVPEKSMIDFQIEIDLRFPDQNRIPIFRSKSISDWKIVSGSQVQTERKIGSRFSYENRSAILISKSICDLRFQIDHRFWNCNRDHDPD